MLSSDKFNAVVVFILRPFEWPQGRLAQDDEITIVQVTVQAQGLRAGGEDDGPSITPKCPGGTGYFDMSWAFLYIHPSTLRVASGQARSG